MVGVVGSSPIAPTNINPGKSLIYRGFSFFGLCFGDVAKMQSMKFA